VPKRKRNWKNWMKPINLLVIKKIEEAISDWLVLLRKFFLKGLL
jgi:hypothetical protein